MTDSTSRDDEETAVTDKTEVTGTETPGTKTPETSETEVPADHVQFSIVFDEDDETQDSADATPDAGAVADTSSSAATSSADGEVSNSDDADAATDSDEAIRVPADRSAEVTAANARRVNETLDLAARDETDPLAGHPVESADNADHADGESTATTLASRIDRRLRALGEDDIPIRAYPTYAFTKVTVTEHKSGRNLIDGMDMACYAGHTYAILTEPGDAVQQAAVVSTLAGFTHPNAGAVMNKSANIAELEPVELRGHRIGLIPQQYAVRGDLDAETNVLMAMEASNRNFLKPKPVIARELLARTGVAGATAGTKVRDLPLIDQRRVAVARAISCEAEVIIADEPLLGLDEAEREDMLVLLTTLARQGDPKRCVIIVTADPELAEATDHTFRMQ